MLILDTRENGFSKKENNNSNIIKKQTFQLFIFDINGAN